MMYVAERNQSALIPPAPSKIGLEPLDFDIRTGLFLPRNILPGISQLWDMASPAESYPV